MAKRDRSWKHLDLGKIDLRLRDNNDSPIWTFKNRSNNNVVSGIFAMVMMFEEKYNIDIVSLIEEMRRQDRKFDAAMEARLDPVDKQ